MNDADLVAALDAQEVPTLEELFVSPHYFGVTTASPLQRAICRLADGIPLGSLAHEPTLAAALASWTAPADPDLRALRGVVPRELCILASTRSGKTRLAGASATRRALTCRIDHLKAGEVPRVPIVSLSMDLARPAFDQLKGTFLASPRLRALLLDEPRADTLTLRHPSGRPVEIVVVAGRRTGASLVARWVASVIFDEAPRMLGSDDGAVVNLSDMLTAVQSRLLDGAQILEIGSPWAPLGPIHAMVTRYHGQPTPRLVVVRAKGPWMNPSWWTEQRIREMRDSERIEDRLAARTDCEAEFADLEEGLFSSIELARCTRQGLLELPPKPGYSYAAAMDPATRGNAWTLVVKTVDNGVDRVVCAREWRGSKAEPLDPADVFRTIAELVRPYGIETIATDQWSADALRVGAAQAGLALVEYTLTGPERTHAYLELAARFSRATIELPALDALRVDLLAVRKRASPTGFQIILPKTADGRHCDFAPALMLLSRQHAAEPVVLEHRTRQPDAYEAAALRKRAREQKTPYWKSSPAYGKLGS
jgi:hypothetical protein